EHVEVVLEIEDLLMAVVRARMASDTASLVPDLDDGRRQLDLDGRPRRQRRGVRVGLGLDATLVIEVTKAHLREIEALAGHRSQMLALDRQRFANGLLTTANDAPQIFFAACQQHAIELLQVTRGGHWHQVIAAEVTSFAFHAT